MGGKGWAVVALAASTILLAGCAAAPELPPGPTSDEVKAIIDRQNAEWWEGIAPGQPRPVIEPIAYIEPDGTDTKVQDCVIATDLDGVRIEGGGLTIETNDPATMDAVNRAYYVCSMQYPYDTSDPEAMGIYSAAQLEYLYDYYATRLVPCLALLGYRVSPGPSRESFIESGYITWLPYYFMDGQPGSAAEWQRIDLRCPPPPFGGTLRPQYSG